MSQPVYRILSEDIDQEKQYEIANALGVSPLVAALLMARGVTTVEKAKAFLHPSAGDLHDPRNLPDMDKAVNRIAEAIDRNEKICIYGDYDVDGVTSVAVIYRYLYGRFISDTACCFGLCRKTILASYKPLHYVPALYLRHHFHSGIQADS